MPRRAHTVASGRMLRPSVAGRKGPNAMPRLDDLGGPALREFAVVLLFGLVLATSSSIFIAAPILLNLGEMRLRRTDAAPPPVPANPRVAAVPKAAAGTQT